MDFPAPYMWSSLQDQRMAPAGPPSWMGSQIEEMRDASGLMYRRNRYYDPSTGRFTQEDPIGIAGGINLYGYAEGDPIHFGDPYGLTTEECCDRNGFEGDPKNVDRAVEYSQQASTGERVVAGGVLAAVLAPGAFATGTAILARLGPGVLARIGAIGGAASKIAQSIQRSGGRPLVQIQRAGQTIGRMQLGQSRAMSLLKTTIQKLGFEHGEDVSVNGTRYLLSQVTSRGGTVRAMAVARDGSISDAVLRQVGGAFEVVP